MRTLLTTALAGLLSAAVIAQDPKPARTPPEKVPPAKKVEAGERQDPEKDPVKAGEQDPKKRDPSAKDGGKTKKPGEAGTEVDLPDDQPLPRGADPADIRAMKGAQEMVSAERRLRARIKAGKIKDIEKLLSFEEISSWPYEDGLEGMPKEVGELDGKAVVMIGFMLPIDEVEDIKEFLLVQSLWACCYGQPPDINGIVRVVMKGDRRCDYQFDPILVKGVFEVEATTEDGYCIDIFQLHATEVSLLK